MNLKLKKLCVSAVFLALCMILPFLTGQIPQIGNMLAPMHIPVLLCGFIVGGPYGFIVGGLAPLLRFVIFGMPPVFPTGIAMSFELAVYGMTAGMLYRLLPKKISYLYFSLLSSMIIGRIIWGVARFVLAMLFNLDFSLQMFLGGAFITAVPGIIIHIVMIPPIVLAFRRGGLIVNDSIGKSIVRAN